MNGSVIRELSRSLKEQFSRSSEAWKEQSDPIFRFWAEGDWWGFPFFSLSASRYFHDKDTLCLYWPLGTIVACQELPAHTEIDARPDFLYYTQINTRRSSHFNGKRCEFSLSSGIGRDTSIHTSAQPSITASTCFHRWG
jgi:hypothetical protein